MTGTREQPARRRLVAACLAVVAVVAATGRVDHAHALPASDAPPVTGAPEPRQRTADHGGTGLRFETEFASADPSPQLHYRASYEDAHGAHRLEVWRDGDRLRRRTDDRLDVHASRTADGDVQLTVLDHARRIRTDVSRTGLVRLGQFSDWFGLAHGLTKPHGDYALRPLASAPVADRPAAACRWLRLQTPSRDSAICWSDAFTLPMLIAATDGSVQWRVQQIDQRRIDAGVFAVRDTGYAKVDANADLAAD